MYKIVKANEETNKKYSLTCEKNNFIGIISDKIEGYGISQIYTLSVHGNIDTGDSYFVEAKYFNEYIPSEKEIDEWLSYTEKFDKQMHNILEETLCLQKEIQLLPEININDMF